MSDDKDAGGTAEGYEFWFHSRPHGRKSRAEEIDDIHDFWFRPPLKGKKSRAEEIDDILAAARAGRLGARAILYTLSFVVAISAAVASAKGWMTEWFAK